MFFLKQKKPPVKKKETVWSILSVVIFALFLKSTVLTIFIIPSGSMIPTLKIGDVLIVNRLRFGISNPLRELWHAKTMQLIIDTHIPNPWFQSESPLIKTRYLVQWGNQPKRWDIVIFKVPITPQPRQEYTYELDGKIRGAYFVQPGRAGMDYVKRLIGLPGDTVEIRNGRILINGEYPEEQNKFTWINDFSYYGPLKVPEGHYFVMGDNRPNSADSRFWGFVPKDHLVGIGTWIALPPWHWKILK